MLNDLNINRQDRGALRMPVNLQKPPATEVPVAFELQRPRPLADAMLKLIWREKQISRADIARRTGLAKSTVSENINHLLQTGLIAESGTGVSGGGRQPIILEFQDDACVILGVEIGASHVAVGLCNLRGRVLSWCEQSHPVREDPVGTRALVAELCDTCLSSQTDGASRLVGIGIAVPSPVDPHKPQMLSEVVIPAWQGHVGLDELAARYNVPLYVDNDANLGALAEYWWGAGRGVDDFIYIKAATGIGAGYILKGEIYRGGSGYAGEIGHLSIDPHGAACVCGLSGCLVTVVGANALIDRARQLLEQYPASRFGTGAISLNGIEEAGLAGDPLALALAHEAAEHFGTAIAGLINIMNPSAVILGGSLSGLGDVLLDPLKQAVNSRTNIRTTGITDIRVSELGRRCVAIGAATFVLDAALEEPRLFPQLREMA